MNMGLATIKIEGAPSHPDDPNLGYWGEDTLIYRKQLKEYMEKTGDTDTFSRHPEILRQLQIEMGLGRLYGEVDGST